MVNDGEWVVEWVFKNGDPQNGWFIIIDNPQIYIFDGTKTPKKTRWVMLGTICNLILYG